MNVCQSLTDSAKLYPEKVALIWKQHTISYSQLDCLSTLAAEELHRCGIKAGDRVAIMLPNSPSFPIWYYGALRIGSIAVSVSTRLAPDEIRYVVEDCAATAFVAGPETLATISDDLPTSVKKFSAQDEFDSTESDSTESIGHSASDAIYQAEPEEPALILYTSGTTGFPKGATLSHANVRSNVHAFNHLCNMRTHDVVLLAVPLFHCFGQNALLNSVLNVGATLVIQQKFDLNESKQLIAGHKVSQLYGVPMMFQLLGESCSVHDLESVNYCFSAAATLPVQVGKAWQEKFGMPIHEGYGLTETSPFASYNHRDRFIAGSIGMPVDSVEMKIVDTETGETCFPGELGEIAIRGPNVMLGYWNRPEDTEQAIRDGWFHSGDIGRVDEQGYFYIVDRVKDMIAIGGLKVFPAEVERVLLDHPAVHRAAVVGVPDDVFGEQVIAFIVADDNSKDETDALHSRLEEHAKSHLAIYKVPRRFFVLDDLPMNPSGKILKTRLREMAQDLVSTTPVPQPSDSNTGDAQVSSTVEPASLRAKLNGIHASERERTAIQYVHNLVTQIGELKQTPETDATFIDAGMDSLMIVRLAAQLQVELGEESEVTPTLMFDYPTIGDMARFLLEKLHPTQEVQARPENQQIPASVDTDLRTKIEQMSEAQALEELMKELN